MMTKKKLDGATTEPPPDWVVLEVAVPPQIWATYERAAVLFGCEPQDVLDHVLKSGYEGIVKYAHLKERHAKAAQH